MTKIRWSFNLPEKHQHRQQHEGILAGDGERPRGGGRGAIRGKGVVFSPFDTAAILTVTVLFSSTLVVGTVEEQTLLSTVRCVSEPLLHPPIRQTALN